MKDLIERLRAATGHNSSLAQEAANQIEKMAYWLEEQAICPFCKKSDVCDVGCQFKYEDFVGNRKMMEVRALLRRPPEIG
ncbi:MAG: hypothetical protein RL535_1112 [Pseudomonadota bacterium]|jgi:radical SAM protein with 4Fe4S-binding SPASM domain